MEIFLKFLVILFSIHISALPIHRQEIVQAHYFLKLDASNVQLRCGDLNDRDMEDISYEWLNINTENRTDSHITTDSKTGKLTFKMVLNTDSESFFCRLTYRLKGTAERQTFITEHIVRVYTNPDEQGNCRGGYELVQDRLEKSSRCYACLPGEYSEDQKCRGCPLSTFNNDYAQDKCLDCPSWQFTLKKGQKTVGDCMGFHHMQDHLLIWLGIFGAVVMLLISAMALVFLIWRQCKIYTNSKPSEKCNRDELLKPLLESHSTEECPPTLPHIPVPPPMPPQSPVKSYYQSALRHKNEQFKGAIPSPRRSSEPSSHSPKPSEKCNRDELLKPLLESHSTEECPPTLPHIPIPPPMPPQTHVKSNYQSALRHENEQFKCAIPSPRRSSEPSSPSSNNNNNTCENSTQTEPTGTIHVQRNLERFKRSWGSNKTTVKPMSDKESSNQRVATSPQWSGECSDSRKSLKKAGIAGTHPNLSLKKAIHLNKLFILQKIKHNPPSELSQGSQKSLQKGTQLHGEGWLKPSTQKNSMQSEPIGSHKMQRNKRFHTSRGSNKPSEKPASESSSQTVAKRPKSPQWSLEQSSALSLENSDKSEDFSQKSSDFQERGISQGNESLCKPLDSGSNESLVRKEQSLLKYKQRLGKGSSSDEELTRWLHDRLARRIQTRRF